MIIKTFQVPEIPNITLIVISALFNLLNAGPAKVS